MMLGIVTVAGDGTWSLEVTTALSEGPHAIVANATDAAGNTATDTSIYTVDLSTTVAITFPADGARVMTATPTITGTGEVGATVVVSVDGTEVGTTTVAADGTWSVVVSTALAEGPHTVSASATDTLGNTASTENDFTVDLGTTVTWEQPSVTGDATPELSGTGEPGASVEVSIDGAVVGTAIVDAEGTWTLVVGPLTDGTHEVSVVATDDAGNTATDDGSFLVDLGSPAVEIRFPADRSTTSDTTPTISGDATPGASVLVIVDGVIVGIATADASGAWSIDVATALSAGEHEVVASVTDADGDTVEDAHTFTVDLDAPSVVIVAPSGTTNDATPTISGTADANATVQVFVDGVLIGTVVADGDGNWSIDASALDDGPHTVRAVATDVDGDSATDASSFVVDTETEVSIDAPANGATVPGPRPTIVGMAEPGASVVVSIGGTEIGTVTADAAGRWSVRASSDLAPGEHTATAEATDEAGNEASATSTFTVGDVDDTDGDGFPDTEECPSEPCRDTDGDGTPDFEDPDDDGDGIPTAVECPGATSCVDSDEDGTPNYLDPDDDGDGILTRDEGSGTIDTDRDGIPDHLDVDDDGDGLLTEDECPSRPCRDTDDDGRPNYLDPDDDGDSIPTTRERADGAIHGNDVDDDGDDNWLDTNSDGDERGDTEEGVGDSDGDGVPDYLDPDVVPMPDGGMPDGGVDGGVPSDGGIVDADVPDAISSDAGVDAGTPPTGGYAGGALCSTTGSSDPSAAFGLAMVGLALAWRRRRR
jgi:MYXO-CTERM domain-containing protein